MAKKVLPPVNLPPWVSRLGVPVEEKALRPGVDALTTWSVGSGNPKITISPDRQTSLEEILIHEMVHVGQTRRLPGRLRSLYDLIKADLLRRDPRHDIPQEKEAYAMQNRASARHAAEMEARWGELRRPKKR